MTLMQQNLTKELLNKDNPPRTLAEAGRRAGYKTIKARTLYRPGTKKHIASLLQAQGITKDKVNEYFKSIGELCIAKEDYTNALRAGENIAKIQQYVKDTAPQQVAIFNSIETELTEHLAPKEDTPSTDVGTS